MWKQKVLRKQCGEGIPVLYVLLGLIAVGVIVAVVVTTMRRHKSTALTPAPSAQRTEASKKNWDAMADMINKSNEPALAQSALVMVNYHQLMTQAHLEYCRSKGMDVSVYVELFTKEHAGVESRAKRVLERNGITEPMQQDMLADLAPQLREKAAQGDAAGNSCAFMASDPAQALVQSRFANQKWDDYKALQQANFNTPRQLGGPRDGA